MAFARAQIPRPRSTLDTLSVRPADPDERIPAPRRRHQNAPRRRPGAAQGRTRREPAATARLRVASPTQKRAKPP